MNLLERARRKLEALQREHPHSEESVASEERVPTQADPQDARPPEPRADWAAGRCTVHARLLVYAEFAEQACWWCRPDLAPDGHAVRKLSADELARLVVVARGAP